MNLILLVLNQDDADALMGLVPGVLASAIRRVLIVHSPALAVDQKKAAEEFDKNLAEIRKFKDDAKARDDFEGAAQYKKQEEALLLDKAKALRDAWKSVPEDERDIRFRDIFRPFRDALNPRLDETGIALRCQMTLDHYEHDDIVQLMTVLKPKLPFKPGNYVLGWPRALTALLPVIPKSAQAVAEATSPAPSSSPEIIQPTPAPKAAPASRKEELEQMRYFSLAAEAKKLGIPTPKGIGKDQLVPMILAKEAELKAA